MMPPQKGTSDARGESCDENYSQEGLSRDSNPEPLNFEVDRQTISAAAN